MCRRWALSGRLRAKQHICDCLSGLTDVLYNIICSRCEGSCDDEILGLLVSMVRLKVGSFYQDAEAGDDLLSSICHDEQLCRLSVSS